MKTKHTLVWASIAVMLLLSGCIRAIYDETPVAPQASPSAPQPDFSVISPVVTPSPAPPPNLYQQPSVVSIAVGETAAVSIRIDGAQRLNGIVLELGFNPAYVSVEDAEPETEGIQITPGEIPQPVQVVQNEVLGEIGRVMYQVSLGTGAAVDGGGVVATITLLGRAEGGTPLSFENAAAFDPDGTPLELVVLGDGIITVTGGPSTEPTPEPTTEPSPSPSPSPQPTTPPSTAQGIYYVVQPRENLYRIALRFGTTAEAIAGANDIADLHYVQAGRMILVPVAPPQGSVGYYVRPGDTLYSIASRFGTTVETLAALNSIGAGFQISPGQTIVVEP